MARPKGYWTEGKGQGRIVHPEFPSSGRRSRRMANVAKSGIPSMPATSSNPAEHSFLERRTAKTGDAFRKFLAIPKPERTPPRNPGEPSGYNGWTNWDTWATNLVLTNDQSTYKWLQEWRKNFEQKIKSGRFDRDAAKFAIYRYIVPVARGKGMAKKRFIPQGFVPDERIDPKMVDYDSILDSILEIGN